MEDLDYLWNYPEAIGELKLKLQYSTTELESVKMEANEQERKYREKLKHLLNLLKVAYQERDEARGQLQKLLNNLMPSSPAEQHQPILPLLQSETPLMIAAAKANSSITESNSSSPVESIFDAVTSPDFSSINMADSGSLGGLVNLPFVQDYSNGLVTPLITKIDPATVMINSLVKGKTLPEKGKLLHSVMEAGPLLQTLLVAGPLPRWRNPPPLQTFKTPPQVSSKGCESKDSNQKPAPNPNRSWVQKRLSSSSIPPISKGIHQMCSAAILNFTSSSDTGSGLVSAGVSTQIPAGKRQRIQ